MKNWTLDELLDLAPGYVMETLSAEERTAFEASLGTSTELVNEVAAHRLVVERLSTEQSLAPSPATRARFLERISSERSAQVAPPAQAGMPESKVYSIRDSQGTPAVPMHSKPDVANASSAVSRSRARWWTSAVMVTAMAASIIFAVNRNSMVTSLVATVAERDSVNRVQAAEITRRTAQIETLLEAEDSLVIIKLASQTANGPGIQFFWNLKQGRGLLHAFKLPPAARGRAYQMWFIKDGKPVPVKVFNSDPDGHGLISDISLPKDLKGVSLMAVTLEPEGGSSQPTSTPFMTGPVTATQ